MPNCEVFANIFDAMSTRFEMTGKMRGMTTVRINMERYEGDVM